MLPKTRAVAEDGVYAVSEAEEVESAGNEEAPLLHPANAMRAGNRRRLAIRFDFTMRSSGKLFHAQPACEMPKQEVVPVDELESIASREGSPITGGVRLLSIVFIQDCLARRSKPAPGCKGNGPLLRTIACISQIRPMDSRTLEGKSGDTLPNRQKTWQDKSFHGPNGKRRIDCFELSRNDHFMKRQRSALRSNAGRSNGFFDSVSNRN